MEAELPLRRALTLANPFSATMARTSQPLRVLAQHLLNRPDAGRQTEAIE